MNADGKVAPIPGLAGGAVQLLGSISPYRRIRKSSWRRGNRRLLGGLRCREHEVVEEAGECIVRVEREYVSDILVGANNDDAALISVDAPQVEDVLAQPTVGAEHLFVVVQPVASLAGQEQGGHGRQVEIAVALLEDGTEIDNCIDVYIRRGEAADRRAWRGGKEGAEGMKAG
jgi:hypothetical protein